MVLGYVFLQGHPSKIYLGKNEPIGIFGEERGVEVEDWINRIVETCAVVPGYPGAKAV